jgi:hypothetical protein
MINIQLKKYIKQYLARKKNTFEKTNLYQVLPGHPDHGSTYQINQI